MVPSKAEEHNKEVRRGKRKPIIPTEDSSNAVTEQLSPGAAAADRAETDAAIAAAAAADAIEVNGTPSL